MRSNNLNLFASCFFTLLGTTYGCGNSSPIPRYDLVSMTPPIDLASVADMATAPDMMTATPGELPRCGSAALDSAGIYIDYRKELLITDVSVVDDPCRTTWDPGCDLTKRGHWTFGYIMQQLAGNVGVNQFIKSWVETYATPQSVNGETIDARNNVVPLMQTPWQATDYSLYKAPFRLLAIVNRVDLEALSKAPGYGSPNSLGEGRLIFGVLGPSGQKLRAAVIFEFNLPPTSEIPNAIQWAREWHKLSTLTGEAYNAQLQKITDIFTSPQGFGKGPNNGSFIAHVRSNELAFSNAGTISWEMRSYTLQDMFKTPCGLNGTSCLLLPSTLANTPAKSFNGSPLLQDWMYANATPILAQQHIVPAYYMYSGKNTLMIASSVRLNGMAEEEVWKVTPKVDSLVNYYNMRQRFAFLTCNGCHYNETRSFNLHVMEREAGQQSRVSDFLEYRDLSNPAAQIFSDPGSPTDTAINLGFNEPRRRACEMVRLLTGSTTRYALLNNSVKVQ